MAARLAAARDLADKLYKGLPRRMQVVEKALVFICPDGAFALYPTHVEFLKLGESREGLVTAINLIADHLAFERLPLPRVLKMNDVVAVLPGSPMATTGNLDPYAAETPSAENAAQIVASEENDKVDGTDNYRFNL